MTLDNAFIFLFLFLGICFGFVSYSNRHLFSEGPKKADNANQNSLLESRVFWVLVCMWLWPIMVITGINSAWILFKRKKNLKLQEQPEKNSPNPF